MGRNLPSTTGLAQKIIEELKPLSEMLPPSDRPLIEKFFDSILEQRVAIANATDLLPLEAALVILQLEERKRTNHEFNRLWEQLQRMQRELDELKPQE